jgi:predicted nucleotidyltransferase
MDKKNYILSKIKNSVNATEPAATLILYGSYARDDYREDSDVDLLILVDFDKVTWADEKRISFPLYDIEFDTGTIISTLILSKKDWETKHKITPFYYNVVKKGKVL